MDRIARFVVVVALCISSVTILESWVGNRTSYANENNKSIVVEIDYWNVCPSRTVEVPWVKDRTVLEALQTVATVETHPVGQYVIVTSIDGVEGKRGEMAWYYTVDGESADKIAYSNVLNNDMEHIKWVYKQDVCSKKVDGEISFYRE